ncbi:hypothetical protein BIV60_12115 [Bacillus sp. MUM 116]|uniref:hypothetical protein n=1 Tax=Bacillus sp. MUM 116 TaxID=1678002 RepID=UPI0008F5E075|nr:hypothetical protein [Bacillus sp. MUM 116]OIK14245.1 hypothetical protein BIV60_12115 [Bacillus sp. MUM 116]
MAYRPTVRYCDEFKNYINETFRATRLDRNQILRLALFVAAHSDEFKRLLEQYKRRRDVPASSPNWSLNDHHLWMESAPRSVGEGGNENINDSRRKINNVIAAPESSLGTRAINIENRCIQEGGKQVGEVLTERKVFTGGIKITLT